MPRGRGKNRMRLVKGKSRPPIQQQMLEDTVFSIDQSGPKQEMIGYVVLAFYQDGSTNMHSWRPNPRDHNVGNTMFEAWARATLERQLATAIARQAADDVIDERYIPPEE